MVTVETDMTDIGTGSYTVIAQTAAEMMGVPLDKVVVRLGDSSFPVSCGSGGQWGGNSSTCRRLCGLREAARGRRAEGRASMPTTPCSPTARSVSGSRSVPLAEAAGDRGLVAEDSIEFGDLDKRFQQATFGAHFVEVGVDAATGETRVRRMLAVCAAGRILNPKTARSQVIGGMTMGVGAALMEELAVDKRCGFFVNHDLASYEVPVHADIPHQEVIFLDEVDPDLLADEGEGRRRARHLRRRGRGGERGLQRHRRAGARLSDHARQAADRAAGVRGLITSVPNARRVFSASGSPPAFHVRHVAVASSTS